MGGGGGFRVGFSKARVTGLMRGYIGLSRENMCPIGMYATDD